MGVFFNAATAMALSRGESLADAILARPTSPEQIDNETPNGRIEVPNIAVTINPRIEFREHRSGAPRNMF